MSYQSLYRRYRPQSFGELRGQDHVSATLRNAVRESRTSHAYLFSGPRGTGKTSTARILAKALNCPKVTDGEPCNECRSCADITEGRSLDVFELDAASHNGVEAMRELVSRAALGTPGRWKVYIVDEAHMLSAAASNALLKTLEEPPGHVVFVLATTEARKVLPTIRSRTQHLEFRLLPVQILSDHLRWVAADAGLDLVPEVIDLVARRGNGSVRDALSALDQVAAAGGIHDDAPSFEELVEALCERDLERAVVAVAERCGSGHDPRQLTTDLLEHLRNAFLATVSRGLVGLPDDDLDRVENQARRLGRASIVRGMELLGQTLVDMREAPDPRVCLEVALVRLCQPETDPSPAALLERIERLERSERPERPERLGAEGPGRGGSRTPPGLSPPPPGTPRPPGAEAPSPTAAARAALRPPPPAPPSVSGTPSRDELTMAWADVVLERLSIKARARFRVGRFVDLPPAAAGAGAAVAGGAGAGGAGAVGFALPNRIHADRCNEVRAEVESALAAHFGVPVALRLVVDPDPSAAPAPQAGNSKDAEVGQAEPVTSVSEEESIDPDELTDAPPAAVASPVDQVLAMFEGATVLETPDT